MNGIPLYYFTPLAITVAVYLFKRYRQMTRRAEEGQAHLSQPPQLVATVVEPPRSVLPRDQRLTVVRDRAATGACLHCDEPATRHRPSLKVVRSPLDPLYRYLGVVPLNRWQIVLHHEALDEAQTLLCQAHHDIERGLLERCLARVSHDYASFLTDQRRDVYEYVTFGRDEEVQYDMQSIKRRKPLASLPAPRANGLLNGNGATPPTA